LDWGTSPLARGAAFARCDAIACMAGIVLLALLVLPALGVNRTRSERFVCLNNLRQLGIALQVWGGDHGDLPPFEVGVSEGGTRQHSLSPNVWFHLAWLSNEVVTPNIFLCPSDSGRPATDFSASPSGGYLHPNFRDQATSYILSHPVVGESTGIVSGDRNLPFDGTTSCARFNWTFTLLRTPFNPSRTWTAGLHEPGGNLLRSDGRADAVDGAGLRMAIERPNQDASSFHFIRPR
jgi:hypothetical protein